MGDLAKNASFCLRMLDLVLLLNATLPQHLHRIDLIGSLLAHLEDLQIPLQAAAHTFPKLPLPMTLMIWKLAREMEFVLSFTSSKLVGLSLSILR